MVFKRLSRFYFVLVVVVFALSGCELFKEDPIAAKVTISAYLNGMKVKNVKVSGADLGGKATAGASTNGDSYPDFNDGISGYTISGFVHDNVTITAEPDGVYTNVPQLSWKITLYDSSKIYLTLPPEYFTVESCIFANYTSPTNTTYNGVHINKIIDTTSVTFTYGSETFTINGSATMLPYVTIPSTLKPGESGNSGLAVLGLYKKLPGVIAQGAWSRKDTLIKTEVINSGIVTKDMSATTDTVYLF